MYSFRSLFLGGMEGGRLLHRFGINQSKTPKDLSDLSIGDTVVAKWGTKDFEAMILKVGRLLLLVTVS